MRFFIYLSFVLWANLSFAFEVNELSTIDAVARFKNFPVEKRNDWEEIWRYLTTLGSDLWMELPPKNGCYRKALEPAFPMLNANEEPFMKEQWESLGKNWEMFSIWLIGCAWIMKQGPFSDWWNKGLIHGHRNKEDVNKLLQGKEGAFLIRISGSEERMLTVCIVKDGEVKRFSLPEEDLASELGEHFIAEQRDFELIVSRNGSFIDKKTVFTLNPSIKLSPESYFRWSRRMLQNIEKKVPSEDVLPIGSAPSLPVKTWTPSHVTKWLYSIKLAQYSNLFLEQAINGTALIDLTEDELIHIGVLMGHAKTIVRQCKKLHECQPTNAVLPIKKSCAEEVEKWSTNAFEVSVLSTKDAKALFENLPVEERNDWEKIWSYLTTHGSNLWIASPPKDGGYRLELEPAFPMLNVNEDVFMSEKWESSGKNWEMFSNWLIGGAWIMKQRPFRDWWNKGLIHGHRNMKEVNELLQGKEGAFLIRISDSEERMITVCLVTQGEIMRFKFEEDLANSLEFMEQFFAAQEYFKSIVSRDGSFIDKNTVFTLRSLNSDDWSKEYFGWSEKHLHLQKCGKMPPPEDVLPIKKWCTEKVARWLKEKGFSQYAESFVKEAINGEALIDLTEDDLKSLGVSKMGDRKLILRARRMEIAGQNTLKSCV